MPCRRPASRIHIQMNEDSGSVSVINNRSTLVAGATARVRLFNLDGTLASDRTLPVTAAPLMATSLGPIHGRLRLPLFIS